jgi:2,4-dienoyl-CoA reductase-like NADH-dependent reductase (Old Yellow Enzyme family)/thioredoxin reductase
MTKRKVEMSARKILEPIKIKSMELKNRIAFGPMLNQPYGEDHGASEDTIRWYVDRAKGEVGFAMTGTINPSRSAYEEARKLPPMGALGLGLTLHDDTYIPGFAKLTEAVHACGMKLGAQIGAGGMRIGASPSPYPKRDLPDIIYGLEVATRELSVEELEEIMSETIATAARAKAAGFDCVELHCAHGYVSLWGAFMSPFSNRREDKYGGSWENRLRFAVETIQGMREAVGEDYPIVVRLSADELLGKDGVTIQDTVGHIIPVLERAGVDCFDITLGSMLHNPNNIPPLYVPRGYFIYLAEAVKKVAKVPVIGVGRILDMEMAEKFLEEGKADIIYLGRQLIVDPETPKKYFEGRLDDIRKCMGCARGFGDCIGACSVDPMMVPTDSVIPAEKLKKLLVIGGGVAGMEAARVAALRGHKVILMEKDTELGGMVSALSRCSLLAEFGNLVDFLTAQLRKLKVDVRVCREATLDDVREIDPDAVILAAGSSMTLPEVAQGKPGIMTHIEALRNRAAIGHKVVIQGLGYGSELAVSLAEEGKDVTLLGSASEIATNLPPIRRWFILKRLTDVDVAKGDGDIPARMEGNPKVWTGVNLKDVTPSEVVVEDKEGKSELLPYDTFIISLGRLSNDSLFEALQGKVSEVYKIGDCSKIGEIGDAMKAANEIARSL